MRIPTNMLPPWLLLLLLGASPVAAELDLRNSSLERLDNGLAVILLEDRNFPVTSVQTLYRVGARDEVTGKTGLAHFLEHMAFRDSENFPDTGLVGSIYARGGEWHGYTWIDQTTYFATVPKEQLDLLLRIEADRMARLEISVDDMDAERGAVLAEMHMYENDPTSMLIDAVLYTTFLGHPYRNNTIGWQSDIENLRHEDVVDFYRRHYHPANAVLVVVGDFDRARLRARIRKLFSGFAGQAPTPLPHTIEPLQNGERRAVLHGAAGPRQFRMAWRAPAASSPDFAAFLVLQSLLGASSGVNFNQNDWGTDVAAGAILDGAADSLTTWYPPSAQDYIFVVGGTAPGGKTEAEIEQAVAQRIDVLRQQAPDKERLVDAIDDVLEQLVYDIETTEDAAHQLALFEGLGAFDTLLLLPELVAAVTADDVQRLAERYLAPERRNIAWYLPQAGATAQSPPPASVASAMPVIASKKRAIDVTPVPLPVVQTLRAGMPVIVQQTDLSPSAYLSVLSASGETLQATRMRSTALVETVAAVRAALADADAETGGSIVPSNDPATRLEQVFDGVMLAADAAVTRAPALIVVSGEVDEAETLALLENSFGAMSPGAKPPGVPPAFAPAEINVKLGVPIAQSQLGYIVPAAGPRDATADAEQLLLYILSHDYEGRLGKAAISERGLAYYIDSRYRSEGSVGWMTLAIGVDPDKIDALRALLKSELRRLLDEPPTIGEVEEAKAHFIGRARSAAQSNAELVASLARQWLWYGDTQTVKQLERKLGPISRQDVLDVIPAFIRGTTIVIDQ